MQMHILQKFKTLYDRHCPVKKKHPNQNKEQKPWLTKTLINACRKKNTLYRQFLKSRTAQSEVRYKRYKNKLNSILKECKKEYYSNLLAENMKYTKKLWDILNNVTNNKSTKPNYPPYFKYNNMQEENPEVITNRFNQFFVNIGPELAGHS